VPDARLPHCQTVGFPHAALDSFQKHMTEGAVPNTRIVFLRIGAGHAARQQNLASQHQQQTSGPEVIRWGRWADGQMGRWADGQMGR